MKAPDSEGGTGPHWQAAGPVGLPVPVEFATWLHFERHALIDRFCQWPAVLPVVTRRASAFSFRVTDSRRL